MRGGRNMNGLGDRSRALSAELRRGPSILKAHGFVKGCLDSKQKRIKMKRKIKEWR